MADNKSPSFSFYSSDFITGTFFMNYAQRGKYITLLCLQHQQGHLSEEDMLSVCGEYDKKIFEKFIQDENGLYYNKRLETEVIKKKAYCESRSNNRKSKNICESYDKDMNNICESYEQHMENEIEIEIDNINNTVIDSNNKIVKHKYGEFNNVLLTDIEYEKLKEKYPFNYQKRIDDLSIYISSKGNKYKSHYHTIISWDRRNNAEGSAFSTFDADEMFEAAIKRSYESED